jgi:polyhydroxyalkanoate synthase subunit PhaC
MNTLPIGLHWMFEAMDAARRAQGVALERAGVAPRESGSQEVLALPGLRLRFYGGVPGTRIALIIPAPIKRHYIWDLTPESSVIQAALYDGMQVYLVEWVDPNASLAEAGLDQYACEWIDQCIDAIQARDPLARPILFSHSLGGILATVYAALRPERISGLLLLETPLRFGDATGSFLPMLLSAPPVTGLTRTAVRIPGSMISLVSANASPATFHAERMADLWASVGSRTALHRHMLVERWALDEAPMAARLFEQIVEDLYRNDRFMRGSLVVDEQEITPAMVRAPLLAVYDPDSVIIPPTAVTDFLEACQSTDKRLLRSEDDVGVGLSHVGTLIGPNAHGKLWPQMLAWTRSLTLH